jgi:hypothetical protein
LEVSTFLIPSKILALSVKLSGLSTVSIQKGPSHVLIEPLEVSKSQSLSQVVSAVDTTMSTFEIFQAFKKLQTLLFFSSVNWVLSFSDSLEVFENHASAI